MQKLRKNNCFFDLCSTVKFRRNHPETTYSFKKIVITSLAVFMSGSVLLSSCALFPKEEEVLAPPVIEAPKVEYKTYEVKRGVITKEIRGTGSFISVVDYPLSFKENSGRLYKLNVKVGDEVKAGQLLAELYSGDLEQKIRQQELTIQKKQLQIESLKDDIESRKRNVELAELNLKDAQNWFLVEKTLTRENNVKKAEIQLEEAQKAVRDAERDLETAMIDLESLEYQLEDYRQSLEKCRIYSPVDGKVVYVDKVSEGDTIAAYRNIIQVADPSNLVLSYTTNEYSSFRPGFKVEVTINNKSYDAQVEYTPYSAPSTDVDQKLKNTVTFKIENPPEDIKLGDTATFIMVLEKKENVLVVPRAAIKTFNGRYSVEVLEDGNRVREIPVEVGLQNNTEVEIVKGIEEGAKIILR